MIEIRHRDTGAVLHRVDAGSLRGEILREADLRSADLRRANLQGADLRWASLAKADLQWANLAKADLTGACLFGANLQGANLTGACLTDADLDEGTLEGTIGWRFEDAPDPQALRLHVADLIEAHPELHDQLEWGDGSANPSCRTPCCVAGWACHLGGGARGLPVSDAATRLLWVDGKPMPSFEDTATREDILAALRS